MEVKLEQLIQKIKKDGVEEAKKQAQEIITGAKREAEQIFTSAKVQAQHAIEEAETRAETFRKNAEDAIRKAGRNTVLRVREELITTCDALLAHAVSDSLEPRVIEEILTAIVKKWDPRQDTPLEILLGAAEKKKLQEHLVASLKKAAERSVHIKISPLLDKGFRIGKEGDAVHYDFSDEGITEALTFFLNPELSAILRADE